MTVTLEVFSAAKCFLIWKLPNNLPLDPFQWWKQLWKCDWGYPGFVSQVTKVECLVSPWPRWCNYLQWRSEQWNQTKIYLSDHSTSIEIWNIKLVYVSFIGTIHKWHHANLDFFWPHSPFSHSPMPYASSICVTKRLNPFPLINDIRLRAWYNLQKNIFDKNLWIHPLFGIN